MCPIILLIIIVGLNNLRPENFILFFKIIFLSTSTRNCKMHEQIHSFHESGLKCRRPLPYFFVLLSTSLFLLFILFLSSFSHHIFTTASCSSFCFFFYAARSLPSFISETRLSKSHLHVLSLTSSSHEGASSFPSHEQPQGSHPPPIFISANQGCWWL